ncbi:MAG: hypothetical protein ACKOXO_11435 [Cyanobium sp.]
MAERFQDSVVQLLRRAPGPLFPRARQLYLRKYCLEGGEPPTFRTFLLEERIEENEDGTLLTVHAERFALVHWHGEALTAEAYRRYLRDHWQLEPELLEPVSGESWFRQGGAWAWFRAQATYQRESPRSLLSL